MSCIINMYASIEPYTTPVRPQPTHYHLGSTQSPSLPALPKQPVIFKSVAGRTFHSKSQPCNGSWLDFWNNKVKCEMKLNVTLVRFVDLVARSMAVMWFNWGWEQTMNALRTCALYMLWRSFPFSSKNVMESCQLCRLVIWGFSPFSRVVLSQVQHIVVVAVHGYNNSTQRQHHNASSNTLVLLQQQYSLHRENNRSTIHWNVLLNCGTYFI